MGLDRVDTINIVDDAVTGDKLADSISIVTTGDITTTGDIGIGTATPQKRLHIADEVPTILLQDNTDADTGISMKADVSKFSIDARNDDGTFIRTLLTLERSGNLSDFKNSDITTTGDVTSENLTVNGITIFTPSATATITAVGGITVTDSIMRVVGDAAPIDITANPQIAAGTDGQIVIVNGTDNTNTVTLDDGDGLNIHGGPMTLGLHDSITFIYNSGDSLWEEVSRNVVPTEKTWAFASPSGGGAVFYIGGHYDFGASDDDFNPSITHGTAGKSEAAHIMFVAAAGATDTVITVSGISIDDDGNRNAADTEVVALDDASANSKYETIKKWLGQVTIEKTAGTDRLANYGFVKYYDKSNTNFTVSGLEVTWLAGASDDNINIRLLHHKATGWTYNNAAEPTIPTPLASLVGDHSTDDGTVSGENGDWKRVNLNTSINGDNGEGTIVEITTTIANTFRIGNFNLVIRST